MLIDKADKEKWLPLLRLSLKHKKKKSKDTSSNSTHHIKRMSKNASSKPGTPSKQGHSNKTQVQRVQEDTTATQKYRIDHTCFAISRFFGTLWVTRNEMTTISS